MQPDLAKAGIVSYGFDRVPAYDKPERTGFRGRAGFVRNPARHGHISLGSVCTLEFSVWTPSAAAVAFGVCSHGTVLTTGTSGRGCLVFDVDTTGSWAPSSQLPVGKHKRMENAILEMRPTHRSLGEKAQEEMSEFERKYPW